MMQQQQQEKSPRLVSWQSAFLMVYFINGLICFREQCICSQHRTHLSVLDSHLWLQILLVAQLTSASTASMLAPVTDVASPGHKICCLL